MSTADVSATYSGTISQTNAASAVAVNAESAGTVVFGGAITANTARQTRST